MKLSLPAKNFSAVTLARFLTIALSFPFFVLLARVWDPSHLGAFTLLWALYFVGRNCAFSASTYR